MSNYLVRKQGSKESQGPYSVDKIKAFLEAGELSDSAEYHDEEKQSWIPLSQNPVFHKAVFSQGNQPLKRKLSLRARESISKESDVPKDSHFTKPPLSVKEIVETSTGSEAKKQEEVQKAKFLKIGSISLALLFFLNAFTLIYPNIAAIQAFIEKPDPVPFLIQYPLLVVSLFDILLGLLAFTASGPVFSLIRFRAMLGLGFFGYFYWAWQSMMGLIGVVLVSVAMFMLTATSSNLMRYVKLLVAGFGGMGILVYTVVFHS